MNNKTIIQAVAALYQDADLPTPSLRYPLAPLGPLQESLAFSVVELRDLTYRLAESYLLKRGSLHNSVGIGEGVDEPLSGFLYATPAYSFLFVKSNDPVVRRRFSIAHEIGHMQMHLPKQWKTGDVESYGMDSFHDLFTKSEADASDDGELSGVENLEVREREADAFAAELLMPGNVITLLARQLKQNGCNGTSLADALAIQMLVSRAAMVRRLQSLDLLSDGGSR